MKHFPPGGSRAELAATLSTALQMLQARHEILRTQYDVEEIMQKVVFTSLAPQVHIEEHRCADSEDALATAVRINARPMPLGIARGHSVLRAAILHIGEAGGSLFLVGSSHMAIDGTSIGILQAELAALCAGTPLPALPIQHVDLGRWQQRQLQSGAFDESLSFWLEALEPIGTDVMEVPPDRPRPPAARPGPAATVPLRLPPDIGRAQTREGSSLIKCFVISVVLFSFNYWFLMLMCCFFETVLVQRWG